MFCNIFKAILSAQLTWGINSIANVEFNLFLNSLSNYERMLIFIHVNAGVGVVVFVLAFLFVCNAYWQVPQVLCVPKKNIHKEKTKNYILLEPNTTAQIHIQTRIV